jgi:dihydroorotate dehydrogenase (fumarate)
MANLQTTYMGIALKNPVIAGASELTAHIKSIERIASSGAGALVIKSLFEEQIQLERFKLEELTTADEGRHAEMTSLFPKMEHAGPKEHLMWIKKAKAAVDIPVIASLNAVNRDTWLDYAKQIEQTGVDGIELNFFAVPRAVDVDGASIEQEQVDIAKTVVEALSIPISVKLSPFYANPLNVVSKLDQVGVKGIVLFNRMFQPDMNVEQEKLIHPLNLSNRVDSRLPLRFAGLLYGNISGDIVSSTGIFDGKDTVKMLLAGAQCVQVVSTLYNQNVAHLATIVEDINDWMDAKGYASLDDFRGKMSKKNSKDPWAYERAQYVKLLFQAEEIINSPALP